MGWARGQGASLALASRAPRVTWRHLISGYLDSMRMRPGFQILGHTPPLGDRLLALALTTLALFDVNSETTTWVWPARLATVLALVPLAWRRTAPLPALVSVCLLNVALAATAPGAFPPQLILLPVMVSAASAAAFLNEPRGVRIAGSLSLSLMWAAHTATRDGDLFDFLPFVLWVGPWVAGRLVRRRTQEVARMQMEAEILREHQEVASKEALARERDAIARELHDVVAHSVSLMLIQAGAERLALAPDQLRTRVALQSIECAGRDALQELRAMLDGLREVQSGDGGPHPSGRAHDLGGIEELVARVRRAGLKVHLTQPHRLPEVAPGAAKVTYRLVQESLTNALKHSEGPVAVTVEQVADSLAIEIRNPGPGSRQWGEAAGVGLLGMRERILLQGGQLEVGPSGDEWVVRAQLPLLVGAVAIR
jgi:signal transduction histidine kinase